MTRLSREMHLALGAKAKGLDSGAMAVAFGAPKGSIDGPLAIDADLRAPLGGEKSLTEALSGPLSFSIAPGRLPGVSLLRDAMDALSAISSVASIFGKAGQNETLQKFYDDEFEELGGSFQLGGGKASTDDLAILYRDYRVDLTGDIALADTALDLEGTLTIYESVDQAIASTPGASAPARTVKRELPLAEVTGTASDPSVSISPKGAVKFAAAYLGGGKLRETIDEKVPGASGVIDALGGLFGGKKKKGEDAE